MEKLTDERFSSSWFVLQLALCAYAVCYPLCWLALLCHFRHFVCANIFLCSALKSTCMGHFEREANTICHIINRLSESMCADSRLSSESKNKGVGEECIERSQ